MTFIEGKTNYNIPLYRESWDNKSENVFAAD